VSQHWFANDGGPMIAIDAANAELWTGNDDPDGSGEAIPEGSDYERACESEYPAGLLPVGGSHGIVVGAQEAVGSAWWHREGGASEAFLVAAAYGDEDSDRELAERLSRSDATDWTTLGSIELASGRVLLLHAACTGTQVDVDPERRPAVIGDALSIQLPPGTYTTQACAVEIEDRALYNVVRLTLEDVTPAAG